MHGGQCLVQLMQQDRNDGAKIYPDVVSRRILLASVVAATEKDDCLSKFVQLGGLTLLDNWLQEAHNGKVGDGRGPKEGDESVETLLVALLEAKNLEIQKKAGKLVDIWKKGVDTEMEFYSEVKAGLSHLLSSYKQNSPNISHSQPMKSGDPMEAATKTSGVHAPTRFRDSSYKESSMAPSMGHNANVRHPEFLPSPQENLRRTNFTGLELATECNISLKAIPDHLRTCSWVKVNEIFVSNIIIGYGSDGTTVKEGYMGDGRQVAVKMLVAHLFQKARKEVELLIKIDMHPNVVRYYSLAQDPHWVYVALERCRFSLYELILAQAWEQQSKETQERLYGKGLKPPAEEGLKLFDNGRPLAKLVRIMRDIVKGLKHLHTLNIVHRDLKPQNVLISCGPTMRAKIADMGLSKQLDIDQESFTNMTGPGSRGWQAPEQLRNERGSRKMDIFTLGSILYHCITNGRHPFGSPYERDGNIMKGNSDLSHIADNPEATNLIERLLHPDPCSRPSADDILIHPFFWDAEKSLSFLTDVYSRVALKPNPSPNLVADVERRGLLVFGTCWEGQVGSSLIRHIQSRGDKYKYTSTKDLLRLIRNTAAHYTEKADLWLVLGPIPVVFYEYFRSRFPRLLIEIYEAIRYYCETEPSFKMSHGQSFEKYF